MVNFRETFELHIEVVGVDLLQPTAYHRVHPSSLRTPVYRMASAAPVQSVKIA